MKQKKGFTLIEMLVVIAVIAVLVSIIIPTITTTTTKAQAAADAANLRSIMGELNGLLADGSRMSAQQAIGLQVTKSKMYPDAKPYILYCNPGFIDAYYVIDGNYYGLKYFAAIAVDGKGAGDSISTSKPVPPAGSHAVYEWYIAGEGDAPEE